MRFGKWTVWTECGWFEGNPPAFLLIKLGDIIEVYPGPSWDNITILEIQVGKFALGFGISR